MSATRVLRGCRAALAAMVLAAGALCHAAPFVYVANAGSDTVSVIDAATNAVVATFPFGNFPVGIAINPTSTRGYVANDAADTVSVFDTAINAVYATVP